MQDHQLLRRKGTHRDIKLLTVALFRCSFISRHGSDLDFIYVAFDKFCPRNLRNPFSLHSPYGTTSKKKGTTGLKRETAEV